MQRQADLTLERVLFKIRIVFFFTFLKIIPEGGGGGGGGGVEFGVVDSSCSFCRNSEIVSSGKVFDRDQMSNNFFIFSYNLHSVLLSTKAKGRKQNT